MKLFGGGISFVIVALLITPVVAQIQTTVPSLNGTWVFKSGKNPYQVRSLEIKQTQSDIQVTETSEPNKKKTQRVLNYFTDGRGESNMTPDNKEERKTITRWKDDQLLMVFLDLDHPSQKGSNTQRRDEWSLSANGETLTITMTVETNRPITDAPFNSLRYPRKTGGSDFKRFQFVEKRVFQKLK